MPRLVWSVILLHTTTHEGGNHTQGAGCIRIQPHFCIVEEFYQAFAYRYCSGTAGYLVRHEQMAAELQLPHHHGMVDVCDSRLFHCTGCVYYREFSIRQGGVRQPGEEPSLGVSFDSIYNAIQPRNLFVQAAPDIVSQIYPKGFANTIQGTASWVRALEK
jgi:hypothetical protein